MSVRGLWGGRSEGCAMEAIPVRALRFDCSLRVWRTSLAMRVSSMT